jgi:hypothetical protein
MEIPATAATVESTTAATTTPVAAATVLGEC